MGKSIRDFRSIAFSRNRNIAVPVYLQRLYKRDVRYKINNGILDSCNTFTGGDEFVESGCIEKLLDFLAIEGIVSSHAMGVAYISRIASEMQSCRRTIVDGTDCPIRYGYRL